MKSTITSSLVGLAFWALPLSMVAADATSETLATVVADTRPAATTYLAVPVAPPPAVGGVLTARNGANVTAANDDWTALATSASSPWLLEITSGTSAGWWSRVTSFDSATQTAVLATTPPAGVVPGNGYQLRRLWTIGELFAGTNATALMAAATPSEADTLIVVDPTTHAQTTYFNSNVAGHTGWHDATFAPADATPLLPGQGIALQRRTTGARVLAFTGVARAANLTVRIAPGTSVHGAQIPGAAPTLAASDLLAAGLQGGASAATADLVIVPQSDGSTLTYFYSTAAGNTGWKTAAGADASAATLPADGAFLIKLQSGAAISWRAPVAP